MDIERSAAAEIRVQQIIDKMNAVIGQETDTANLAAASSYPQQAQNFKAIAAIMQAQMMSEAFNNSNDNDSSNPMASMFGAMGMSNPMNPGMTMNPSLMGLMMQNPQMMGLLMQQQGFNYPVPIESEDEIKGFDDNELHNHFHHEHSQDTEEGQTRYGSNAKTVPVQGRVSSTYGNRTHPVTGHGHFHSGVDIAAAKGSPIRMPWDGKVVFVGNVDGFGPNTVIVAHEGKTQADGKILYSIFGHNSKVLAHNGDSLKSGEVVATVGSEGRSTGPHLHWEVRVAPAGITGKDIFKKHIAYTIDPMTVA